MAAVNKIIKYNLEDRVRELNESGTSLRDIADILTSETNRDINKNSVSNFLKVDVQATAELIEKKAQLRAVVAEAEISTIEDRKAIIQGLLTLANTAESEHVRAQSYKIATEALDSLDKRLGKLSNSQGVTINNINAVKLSDIPTEQLLRMANASR